GATVVCNALLVQRGAPDALRGRAFTVLMSSTAVTLGAGMIAAGIVTNALGARWVWGIAAGILAVAAALGLVLARGVEVGGAAPRSRWIGIDSVGVFARRWKRSRGPPPPGGTSIAQPVGSSSPASIAF